MLRRLVPATAGLFILLGSTAASSHGVKTKSLEIVHPWTLATLEARGEPIVRMTIKNISGRRDRLLAATTRVAGAVELRDVTGPATSRTKVPPTTLHIRSLSRVALTEDGPHLVLKGLAKPLAPYDSFVLTLVFERAGRIEVEVLVEE